MITSILVTHALVNLDRMLLGYVGLTSSFLLFLDDSWILLSSVRGLDEFRRFCQLSITLLLEGLDSILGPHTHRDNLISRILRSYSPCHGVSHHEKIDYFCFSCNPQYFVDVVKDKRTKNKNLEFLIGPGVVTFLTTSMTRGSLYLIWQGRNIWFGNSTRSGNLTRLSQWSKRYMFGEVVAW